MKTYIFVGGNSGIAREILKNMSGDDCRIVCYCRKVPDSGGEHISWNVHDEFPGLPEGVDKIDGILYAPGTITLKPFSNITREQFRQDMEINFFAAIPMLQAALPLMKKGGGSVLFFSSVAASVGMAYHSSIASAKAALEGFARAMAAEYSGADIRFNVISLSLVDTPLAARLLSSEEKRSRIAERHPLKRIGDPVEIARFAADILKGGLSWMSGEVIHIDGGILSTRA